MTTLVEFLNSLLFTVTCCILLSTFCLHFFLAPPLLFIPRSRAEVMGESWRHTSKKLARSDTVSGPVIIQKVLDNKMKFSTIIETQKDCIKALQFALCELRVALVLPKPLILPIPSTTELCHHSVPSDKPSSAQEKSWHSLRVHFESRKLLPQCSSRIATAGTTLK